MVIGIKEGISLEELAQRSRQNDQIAQRLLYESLAGKMLAVCCRYVGDRETAKDVMHDGFIRLFEKLGSFSETGSFEGWARRIFVNISLTHLRKSNVLKFSEPVDDLRLTQTSSDTAFDTLSTNDLLACISSMPHGFRTVFNLFAIEGYSHDEIAEMLHIRESTSRSQYIRARKWLQRRLKEYI
jgi:RNA polymerase sigma-70 factor (ECF subfamily)